MSQRCSFCGFGPERQNHFMEGLPGHYVCDNCTQLMTDVSSDRFVPEPPQQGVRTHASVLPLTRQDAEETRHRFEQIRCSFCGRTRAEFGPGGVAGATPATFICSDCLRKAAAELLS
jgi:hypothetical protein